MPCKKGLVTFGVFLSASPADAALADIRLNVATLSPCGGFADGVLGCTSDSNTIPLLVGWNWYTAADSAVVGSGQYDFQTIVTHELGHAVGLGHSYDRNSAMYSVLATGVARRNLTAADLSFVEPEEDGAPEALFAHESVISAEHRHTRSSPRSDGADDRVQVLEKTPWSADEFVPLPLDGSSASDDDVLIGGDGDDVQIGERGCDQLVGGISSGQSAGECSQSEHDTGDR